MSREIKVCLKFNVDTVAIRKFKVRDLNGSTVFVLASGTWSLTRRPTGVEIGTGAVTVNNNDTDQFGNTIKTVSMTIDLRNTDAFEDGSYFLVIKTALATQQTDFFRIPVELVDYREKGAA